MGRGQFIPETGVSGCGRWIERALGLHAGDLDSEREVEVGVVSWERAPECGSPG